MGGTNRGSGNSIPFRIVPFGGKIREDDIKASFWQLIRVFNKHHTRAVTRDSPHHVMPGSRARARKTRTAAPDAYVLTWKPTREQIKAEGYNDIFHVDLYRPRIET